MLGILVLLIQAPVLPQMNVALPATPKVAVVATQPATSPAEAPVGTSSSRETNIMFAALTPPALPAPPPALIAPVRPLTAEKPMPRFTRSWLALTAIQHTAATVDAWSTRRGMNTGRAHETNPLLASFAGSNALYPAMQITPAVMDVVGLRFQHSRNHVLRKVWWVPQVASTAVHLWAISNNMRVYQQTAH